MTHPAQTQKPENSIPPFVNSMMRFMLRSPLHPVVSKSILLITFQGRKSGRIYTTPVSYSEHRDGVYAFTHAKWWKNLRGGAPVTLRIRGRETSAIATALADDRQAVSDGLLAHLNKVPSDAKFYKVRLDADRQPVPEDVLRAAETVVMIRFEIC
jgi:deazaflavin-dependent oxidoreductase (nitroreductase family)